MEGGEDIQISRKRQPLLLAKQVNAARRLCGTLNVVLFLDLADLFAQPGREGFFQFQLGATAIEVIDRLTLCR